jgi:hypothetical protein
MRRVAALQTCVALLLAFFVSPFQHVHPGSDHDHSATMHAHFYSLTPVLAQLEDADDDDHDAVWAVDSFTLVPTALLTLFVPTRSAAVFFVRPIPVAWVDVVEKRGHDPPQTARSIPRAPPS